MDQYDRRDKVRVEVGNKKEEMEHFHQDVELIYVLEGSLTVQIGNRTIHMDPEDIFVINANKKHSLSGSDDILFARILIEYHLISDIIHSVDIFFWCDSTKEKDERYDALRSVLKKLLNHYLAAGENTADFGHIALCYQVMEILTKHFLVQTADKENINDGDRFEERLLQINNYIRANYNQQISLKDLSEKLYLSNGYLSRFFKKNYGMSFVEYLSNVRLYHAVDELLYTDAPITRIAYDNGFASVTVFNRLFKNMYGETPSVFRRKSAESVTKDCPKKPDRQLEMRLEKYLTKEGEEPEPAVEDKNVKVRTSASAGSRVNAYWRQMVNIGAAEDLLRSEVREHVLILKETLGFRYLRFWNLFSREMLIDGEKRENGYNFSRVDSVLDFVIGTGMKPHIELGRKPRRVLRKIGDSLIENWGESESISDEAWEDLLNSFMQHILRRYGQAEIESWRMELWMNERYPKDEKIRKRYFRQFNLTYRTVRKYCQFLEVGGCGFRGDFEKKMDFRMLVEWKDQECIPDFISMIQYAYIRGEEDQDRFSRRNTDSEAIYHAVEWMKESMEKAGLGDRKLYMTEWNLTLSDRNYINDTCFKGAYILKNIFELYGKVDAAGYFTGTDRFSEYYDSGQLLHGGTGLISRDGILKPAGFAFEFLNRLYPYYIDSGTSYLITSNGHGSYGIVCHNMRSLNYNYYFTKEDEIEKEHIWKYCEDNKAKDFEFVLTDLENGDYQQKTYRISEKNGSVLDIWKEAQFIRELEREDIKYFKRICEPKMSIGKIESEKGMLKTEIRLQPNEIVFIKIQKLYVQR